MKVGTAPAKVLAANDKRIAYSLVNNSASTIYTGGDDGVTVTSGEPLPAGAMVSDDDDKEDVYAVASVDGLDVRVTEILRRD